MRSATNSWSLRAKAARSPGLANFGATVQFYWTQLCYAADSFLCYNWSVRKLYGFRELHSRRESFGVSISGAESSALFWGLRQATRPLQGPALVALAYFVGAEVAFYIGTLSDRIFALFWPPNVILFCALLIVPQRSWWLLLPAAFPAHGVAEAGVGIPAPQLLVAFATNCLVEGHEQLRRGHSDA